MLKTQAHVTIDVLFFANPQVKQQLFARVTQAKKLLMVTTVPPNRANAARAHKEPYGSLERRYGDLVDQVLVVDEGGVEGMWRDPVTDLADALYPSNKRAAYAAASGYLFVEGGRARSVVKKFGTPEQDLWFLQEALAKLSRHVAPPDPDKRPGYRKGGARSVTVEREDEPVPASAPLKALGKDPWAVLGVEAGATFAEVKRAWRALLIQYHPDKVAHLAPEFRTLAEVRTREIMEAYAALEAELAP